MSESDFNDEIPCPELAQFIGDRIRIARKAKGLTQGRVSEMLGNKSPATVNRFENGERPPSIEQLIDLDTESRR
ncbi:MAG: helix-turn-helix transcriptional regulator [Pseudomonadota bacterium]